VSHQCEKAQSFDLQGFEPFFVYLKVSKVSGNKCNFFATLGQN